MTFVAGTTLTAADLNAAIAAAGGAVYIDKATPSAASSISINNCFTSAYDWYQIRFRLSVASGTPTLGIRLRASGTDNTSSNYYDSTPTSTATSAIVAGLSTTEGWGVIDVFDPARAVATVLRSAYSIGVTGPAPSQYAASHNVSSAFDGFTLTPASSTITGTIRVYGYRNS